MNGLRKQYLRRSVFGVAVLSGLAALGAVSPRASAQSLKGEVTLPVEAKFGSTILPAGTYKFSVQPVGIAQAINFNLSGNNQVLVSMSGVTKGSPTASVIATALMPSLSNNKEPGITLEEGGNIFHSMYLENQGVLLKFHEYKPKNVTHAHTVENSGSASAAKGNV
jgi:hypothetical protein